MYNDFRFYVPKIEFGVGITKRTSIYAAKLQATKVLIVCDKGVKNAGIVDPIAEDLRSAGMEVLEYDGVQADPKAEIVDEIAKIAKDNSVDCVISVGGGSSLDAGKAAKMLITNEGNCLDYNGAVVGTTPFKADGVPFIAIPTTSGTGSEVSCCSVITDAANNHKIAIVDYDRLWADIVLLDPELTLGLPASITAGCGMDVFAHAVEAMYSIFATPFTDPMNLAAIEMTAKALPEAVKNGSNLQARADMAIASTIAQIGCGNANANLGHGLAHAMGSAWHIPHGVACALAMPYVFKHLAACKPDVSLKIARAMGCEVSDNASAQELRDVLVTATRNLIHEIGIPSAVQLGHSIDELELMMSYTRNEWALCQLAGIEFTEEDCRAYFTEMLSD